MFDQGRQPFDMMANNVQTSTLKIRGENFHHKGDVPLEDLSLKVS